MLDTFSFGRLKGMGGLIALEALTTLSVRGHDDEPPLLSSLDGRP